MNKINKYTITKEQGELKLGGTQCAIASALVNIVDLSLTQASAPHAIRICRRAAFWFEFIIGKKE